MSSLFEQSLGPSPKIHITSGPLPSHFAASQAPTKRLPWRAIRDVDIVHSTTAVLPDELYQVIWQDVENGMADLQYAKVSMKVEELLSGAFFNDHVKRGKSLQPRRPTIRLILERVVANLPIRQCIDAF